MTKTEKAVLIQGFKNISQDIADLIAVLEGADAKKQDTGSAQDQGPAQERSQGSTPEHAPEAVQEHSQDPAKEHTQEPAQDQEAALEHSQGSAQEQNSIPEPAQEQNSIPEPAQEQTPAPEQKKVYTYEEVRAILAEKARTGFRAEVKAILTAHGVQQLSSVKDPDVYAAIVAEAATIGGQTVDVPTAGATVKPATGATNNA